ncbi:MAG: hypothetical protein ACO3A2_00070 [Bdellovibrionia bacterium]
MNWKLLFRPLHGDSHQPHFRLSLALVLLGGVVLSCGRGHDALDQALDPPPGSQIPGFTEVLGGKAQFGTQCPYGFSTEPASVPLELWNCPMAVSPVELTESLRPVILQVDCKKKTMDLRGVSSGAQATTWELMPDGTFFLSQEAGEAILKSDGAGHLPCRVPLKANFWGKVDCKTRDEASIQLETLWWLGEPPVVSVPEPTGSPHPQPLPSSSMGPASGTSRAISAHAPSAWGGEGAPGARFREGRSDFSYPMPEVSSQPFPIGQPSSSPSSSPSTQPPTPDPRSTEPVPEVSSAPGASSRPQSPASRVPLCQVPVGCYFHNLSEVRQCY